MKRLALALCLAAAGAAHAADMLALHYVDQDAGEPPYATRILVTPAFLRMDGGTDDGDFVLLDRRKREVINVMRGARAAMVFRAATLPPRPANWKARLVTEPAATGTLRFRLSVGEAVCSEGIVAPRAAPDAARAMSELKRVLRASQYRVWKDSPPELRHDCDLANQVWESGAVLKLGLPLEEREFSGRTRSFEQQAKEPLRPELFRVPEGLARIDAPS